MFFKNKILLLLFVVTFSLHADDPIIHSSTGLAESIWSDDPNKDSLHIQDHTDGTILFTSDISLSDRLLQVWADVTIRGLNPALRLNVTFDTLDFDDVGLTYVTIESEKLTLDNVSLTNKHKVVFVGNHNEINMMNSSVLHFDGPVPAMKSGASLALNIISGDNIIKQCDLRTVDASAVTLDIASGTSLSFNRCGTLNSNNPGYWLNIPNLSGTVDGGTLGFVETRASFGKSNLHFINGAELRTDVDNSYIRFSILSFTDSQMTLGASTYVEASANLTLDNSDVVLGSAANLIASALIVDNTVNISGGTLSGQVDVGGLTSAKNTAVLNLTSIPGNLHVDYLLLDTDFTINSNNTDIYINRNLDFLGGTLNLGADSYLNLAHSTIANAGSGGGTLNLGLNSSMDLLGSSVFNLDPSLTFTMSEVGSDFSVIRLKKNSCLSGDGEIQGGGEILVWGEASIRPGDYINYDALGSRVESPGIGTIRTDSAISFEGLNGLYVTTPIELANGAADGGYYHADIRVNGGIAENDQLLYGDGDVDLGQIQAIRVNALGPHTATDLDGRLFTVIAAQDPTKLGTIDLRGQTINIDEGGDIPALIDFIVTDLNTNGRPDVTLLAQSQSPLTLHKHPNLTGRNHKAAASLLGHAAHNGNTAVAGALNNLTNAQVAAHFNTVHAEAYSSNMTIALEQTDMMMNNVLALGRRGKSTPSGSSQVITLPDTRKRTWMNSNYLRGDIDGDGELGSFDYSFKTMMLGTDLSAEEDHTFGAYFAYIEQKMDEHDAINQDISSDSFHLGLYYDTLSLDGWDIRSVMGYTYGSNESTRRATLGNVSERSKGSFDSHSLYLGLRGSFVLYENNWISLEPELGINYSYYYQDAFDESGSPTTSLAVDSADAHAIVSTVGINARFASLLEETRLSPVVSVRYERDWYADSNSEHEIDAGLVSQPGHQQSFVGRNRGEDTVVIGLGLEGELGTALELSAGIVYSTSSHGDELGGEIKLTYRW